MSRPWITIGDGEAGRPAVLAVDFDATGRKDATFHDLVESFPRPLNVRLSGQPPHAPGEEPPPVDYLAWWDGGLRQDAVQVGAVLGYCAGSVFASALADEIERRQGSRPEVVLFNPGKPDTGTLKRDFDGVVQSMSLLEPGERSHFLEKAGKHVEASPDAFDEVADTLYDLYGQAARITFERAEIDADVGEELIGVFRSYISYLRAARRMEYRGEWTRAAALVSRGHVQGPEFTRTPIYAEVDRRHLLGDPDVAGAAFRLIGTEV